MTSRPRVFLPPSLPVFLQLIDPSFDTGIAAHTCCLGLRTAVLRMKTEAHVGLQHPVIPQQMMTVIPILDWVQLSLTQRQHALPSSVPVLGLHSPQGLSPVALNPQRRRHLNPASTCPPLPLFAGSGSQNGGDKDWGRDLY